MLVDMKAGSADDAGELSSEELVTIGRAASPVKIAPSQYQTVLFKVCVLRRGRIWYVQRTLLQVKGLMVRA